MNIEITGTILEQITVLAERLEQKPEGVLLKVIKKGLKSFKCKVKIAKMSSRVPPDATKFIQENWEHMSVTDMAAELNLTTYTVYKYQRLLGLKRQKGFNSTHPNVPKSVFDEGERKFIYIHPEMSHEVIAGELKKSAKMVRKYRCILAKEHLSNNFSGPHEDTDASMAPRFGLKAIEYSHLRRALGYHLATGGKGRNVTKISSNAFGSVEEIRFALQYGGETIQSLINKKKLPIMRERGRQILADLGLVGSKIQRDILWYAHRLVGEREGKDELAQQLINVEWVTEQLAQSGGCRAMAGKLGVSEDSLKTFIRIRLHLKHKELIKSHGEMVCLSCTWCSSTFWRRKKQVEAQLKRHPNQKTYFCKQTCKGKWLGNRGRTAKQS
jgi:hypothetical protein